MLPVSNKRQPVPVFRGVVDPEGKLHLDARQLFRSYLQRLKNSGVELVIRKQGRPKSRNQLGYLWGVLYPVIAEHFGYSRWELDALHDGCVRAICGLKPEPNPLALRQSLAEMSHEEVSAYISDLRAWALMEHGIVTPDSDAAEAA